jgi:hypothetical protein
MLHIYATQKLRTKLPLDANGQFPPSKRTPWLDQRTVMPTNSLSGWHAHLLTLQRRQCVLMVHDATRFPVFIPCLTKADFAEFNYRFVDAFMNTLLKCGADTHYMDAAHASLQPLQVDAPCNRSVLGTLNQMQGDVEHMLWYDSINVAELTGYRVGAWLADRPTKAKGTGWLWPQKDMLALLEGMTIVPDEPTAPDNVILLQEYRGRGNPN